MIRTWLTCGALVLGLILLASPVARAYEECSVSSSAQQTGAVEGYKYTAYTFEVTLAIEAQCADISYALVVEERLENGDLRKKPLPRTLILRSSRVTEYHEYKTLRVNTIEGVSVEGIRCNVCL